MSEAGAAVMEVTSARRIAWLRRRRAFGRAWHEYRHHLPGMIGLGILVLAVAMALAAPLLADESGLRAINTVHNPTFASPANAQSLSTSTKSDSRRSRWVLRKSLMVRKSGMSSPTMTRQATSVWHRFMILREERVPVA